MNTDPYLATKDIEERKRLCAEHMRTYLSPDNMSYMWYGKNYKPWARRAEKTFSNWNSALKYVFTQDELKTWAQRKKEKCSENGKNYPPFSDQQMKSSFVKEYLYLKSIPGFGHFNSEKYIQNKSKNSPSDTTIRKHYKTFKNFYTEVAHEYPHIYFDPIPPYTEEDCKNSLIKAYNDFGCIYFELLTYPNGYVPAYVYVTKYGSLENACKKFHIPYMNKHKDSKLLIASYNTITKLLNVSMNREQKWPWLKYKKPLSVDIFIPFLNLAIEVDGEQHYKKVQMWDRTGNNFKTRQICDKIKNVKLPEHNITLIRIKYNEVKKIPIILKPYVELLKTIQEYCAY